MSQKLGMLSIGDVLDDKYVIDSIVGRGGMGVVYRARHRELNAFRAIKVMHPELAQSRDFLDRFRNEAKLAEELRHPNIVTLHDLSSLSDGTPYIVWEFVEGETLSHAFHGGIRFTTEETVDLVGQVASGLEAAHERHIVHRDISPDNLMLARNAEAVRALKVLDFGMAKFVGSITEPGSGTTSLGVFLGKIGYSSPEQVGLFEDMAPLDRRTDVFSLAVVAYRMLVGKLPFRTSSIQAFLFDLTTAPEEDIRERFTSELEPAFRNAFSRALSRNREHRTPSTDELKRDLERALGGRTATATATGKSRPPMDSPERGRAHRRRFVLQALSVTFVLAGLLVIGATWLRRAATVATPVGWATPPTSSRLDPSVALEPRAIEQAPSERSNSEIDAALSSRPVAEVPPIVALPRRHSQAMEEPAERRLSAPPPARVSPPLEREASHPAPEPVTDTGRREPVIQPLNAFGSVSVTADLWFEVRLDGGPLRETPVFFRRVDVGRHELRVSRPGEPQRSLDVIVREGETTAVQLDGEPRR